METCPESAILVRDNRITIQPELCIGCGSCASECPTQALRTIAPSASELVGFVDEVADRVLGQMASDPDAPEPMLEFACEHAQPSSAAARIVVPALPYVDESVLVHAAARGFRRIALTTCNQARCTKPTMAAVPDILVTARALLEAAGSDCRITLRREKPPAEDEDAPARGKRPRKQASRSGVSQTGIQAGPMTVGRTEYSRRGMLSDMASQAQTIVAETAAAEMRERLGVRDELPSLRQTLTDGTGNMLKFEMPRAMSLLDDLYALNPEPKGMLNTRGFARVEVNAEACRRCAMCARFCPTGALQGEAVPIGGTSAFGAWGTFGGSQDENPPQGSLTWRMSDCVGCHLCEFTCPLHCLRVHDEVDAADIFELEPIDLLA